MSEPTGFYCSSCGEWHAELPLNYGADVPDIFYDIPEEERDKRIEANDDFCIVDNQYFFVRGNLEIPIQGSEQTFSWGVWVSLSEKNFNRSTDLLDKEGRESEPPYFGWLSTSLPYPESTLNLKTLVHTQPVGIRPLLELEPTAHPLSVDQRQGITLEHVQEIAEHILHG